MSLAACTIVSKNYLAFARVLARSFARHHPEGRFFVLLVDRVDGAFDPAAEPFELVAVEALDNVPSLPELLFQYTLLEANTAVKPFFLEHLFARHRPERLVYFDPDILVCRPLAPIERLLADHDVVLTPHLTHPVDDGRKPSELDILRAGTYNLGFIALRASQTADRLLTWWQSRLVDQCVVRFDLGLFVDQKWMDLVPGLWERVAVARDPGLNVAYWNLHGRRITGPAADGDTADVADAGGYEANGEPLYFFHFSGIQLEALELVSKHQDRFRLGDLGPAVGALYRGYRAALLAAGHRDLAGLPYAFATFADGTPIPAVARAIYRELGDRRRFPDPFAAGPGTFRAWLDAPHPLSRPADGRPPYLSHLLYHLYRSRPDLAARFPRAHREQLADFAAWMRDFGRHEHPLPEVFLAPLGDAPAAPPWTTPAGLRRRLRRLAGRALRSPAGRAAKSTLRRLLGRDRLRAVKWRLRGPAATAGEDAAAMPRPRLGRLALVPSVARPGINLVGYLGAETGMGEAARGLLAACHAAEIPVAPHDLDLNVRARRGESSLAGVDSGYPYDVNLLVVNADQVPAVTEHLGSGALGGRYNVGLWLWELETFPEAWRASFAPFHEIWTPSTFCVDAISRLSPLPVRRVPLPVTVPDDLAPPAEVRRRHDIPEDAFACLFAFDFLSYWQRKNPLAVVEAFRRAFVAEPASEAAARAVLVLKTSSSELAGEGVPAGREPLRAALDPLGERVVWIDEYLERREVWELMAAVDAYVSLHRAEGYGLTLAEAMALGKPVVATPYSGNRDFFDERTGFPVAWELVEIAETAGPYGAGARWAEPDVADAARRLRALVDDPTATRRRAERGRREVRERLSTAAVGAVLRERFREILVLTRELG